tara:strand:- start:246 stop:413 length:168 start_codon:yes stop_codon:yes gene_type:complete
MVGAFRFSLFNKTISPYGFYSYKIEQNLINEPLSAIFRENIDFSTYLLTIFPQKM